MSASAEQLHAAQLVQLAARVLATLAGPVALAAVLQDVEAPQTARQPLAWAAMAAEPAVAELGLADAAVEQPVVAAVRAHRASVVLVLLEAPQPWAIPVSFLPEELRSAPAVLQARPAA